MNPFASFAQKKIPQNELPVGKARIFVLFHVVELTEPLVVLHKASFFINRELVCKFTRNTFTYFDVEPGTYFLAAQESGKRMGKKTTETELEVKSGAVYYFEIKLEDEFFQVIMKYQQIPGPQFDELAERKKMLFTENCNLVKPGKNDPFTSKRFFIRVPVGYAIPSGNFKNWWPADFRSAVNRFQPFMFGFEAGVKVGRKNHFLSWEFTNSRQSPVAAATMPGQTNYISINTNTLYYAYAFSLDGQNKCLLYPKIGYSILNYILESRSGTGGGFTGVDGSGICGGLYVEYRISRALSVDGSWNYLDGTTTFKNEQINLTHQRLFAGVRVQF